MHKVQARNTQLGSELSYSLQSAGQKHLELLRAELSNNLQSATQIP